MFHLNIKSFILKVIKPWSLMIYFGIWECKTYFPSKFFICFINIMHILIFCNTGSFVFLRYTLVYHIIYVRSCKSCIYIVDSRLKFLRHSKVVHQGHLTSSSAPVASIACFSLSLIHMHPLYGIHGFGCYRANLRDLEPERARLGRRCTGTSDLLFYANWEWLFWLFNEWNSTTVTVGSTC
jgi:hypothetical protein